jgi:hypothetical protein
VPVRQEKLLPGAGHGDLKPRHCPTPGSQTPPPPAPGACLISNIVKNNN